jgi:hypothetical protein
MRLNKLLACTTYEMRHGILLSAVVLAAVVGTVFPLQQKALADNENSPIQPNTVWKGEIRQDRDAFPAAIYFQSRDKDRIKGEVHFTFQGDTCKLTFEGNVVDGRTVVWITDKKEGNVTFPGLYIGKVEGKTITGTWQVPSAKQYDRFSVTLAE